MFIFLQIPAFIATHCFICDLFLPFKLISLPVCAAILYFPCSSPNGLSASRLFRYLHISCRQNLQNTVMPGSHSETASALCFWCITSFVSVLFSDFSSSAVSLSDKCHKCLGGKELVAVVTSVREVALRWPHTLASLHHRHNSVHLVVLSPIKTPCARFHFIST